MLMVKFLMCVVVLRKSHPLIKILNSTIIDLPTPSNIRVNWNYGSLLGVVLVIQLVSGIFLAMRYSCNASISFDSVVFIFQDVPYGWLLRLVHSTGATFFFVFLYLHIGRGLYYGSFTNPELWNIGVLIFLLVMARAFLGYVLPWGQMSFWGATVITRLFSTIPYFGPIFVEWLWGDFSVSNATLTRFFALHYLTPFLVTFLVLIHIFFLHSSGRSNPLGISSNTLKIPFHYYYRVKDTFYFILFFFVFLLFTLKYGYHFIDPENFIEASTDTTPQHIQPEWYFLFAYAILRCIPNKLGGVIAMFSSIAFLFLFSVNSSKLMFSGFQFSPVSRFVFWLFVSNFCSLTYLGAFPAEAPFDSVALFCTIMYFFTFVVILLWSHCVSYNYLRTCFWINLVFQTTILFAAES